MGRDLLPVSRNGLDSTYIHRVEVKLNLADQYFLLFSEGEC
jgi:hypothetical protein